METIPCALFGQTHKPVKKEDIINWKNRRACLVELNFRKGEDRYFVRRGIKPNVLEIYENDELIDKPAHLRDYQAILEGIIGLNFQTFVSLIHSNINSSLPVLAMKKPEKRKFIEKVFGLELYSLLNDKANEKLRAVGDKIREAEIKIEANNNRASEIVGNIASLEAKIRQTSSTELELRDKTEKLKELQEDYNDEVRLYLPDATTESDTKNSSLQVIIYRINNQNINYIQYKKLPPLEQSLSNLKEDMKKIEELQEKIKILDGLKRNYISLDNLTEEKDNKRKTFEKIKDDLRDFESQRKEKLFYYSNNKKKISDNKLNIESLKENSICPTCGQKIKDIPQEHIDSIIKENKILTESCESIKKELSEMDEKKKITEGDIEFFEKEVRKADQNWNYMFNIENELSNMPEVDPDHVEYFEVKIEKYIRVKQKLLGLIGKLERQIKQISNDINLLTERKSYLDAKYKEIQELEGNINRLEQRIQLEEENKKEFQAMLDKEKSAK